MRGQRNSSAVATCVVCRKQKPVHKLVGRNRTFNLAELTFRCGARACRWIPVRCTYQRSRRCRRSWLVPPSNTDHHLTLSNGVGAGECGPCRLSKRARRLDYRLRILRRLIGNKAAVALIERAKQGDMEAATRITAMFRRHGLETLRPGRIGNAQKLLECHAPSRRAARIPPLNAIGHLTRADLTRAFHLCPLCLQLLYEPRYHYRWVTRYFHPICLKVWRVYSGQYWASGRRLRLPPVESALGRPLDTETLKRGYICLMRLKGESDLVGLARRFNTSKPNILASIRQFFRYAPARWEYVFAEGGPGNRARDELCRLIHELRSRGLADDPLREARATRLLRFGMEVEEIAALTGWPVARVREEAKRTSYQPAVFVRQRRRAAIRRAWRKRQRLQKKCLFCTQSALPGRSQCAKHRQAQREREMRLRPMICGECQLPIANYERTRGRRFHPDCAQKRRTAQRHAA